MAKNTVSDQRGPNPKPRINRKPTSKGTPKKVEPLHPERKKKG